MRRIWAVRVLALVAVLGLTIVSTSADQGGNASAKAKLSGFSEVTPKLTNGTGTFKATISGGTLTYTLTFSGLSSDAIMAHIHFAQRGVNGNIFLWLCDSVAKPGPVGTPHCPATGGTVSRSVTAADIQPIADQNVSAGDFAGAIRIIRSGDAYVNVHTTKYVGGEIRGQINPVVPEPSSLALLGLGTGALVVCRLRRRTV